MKLRSWVVSLAILATTASAHAQAPAQIEATTCPLFGNEAADEGRQFFRLSAATGTGSHIGDPGQAVTGLAFHPFSHVLYGATAVIDVNTPTLSSIDPGHLITIDPRTGHGTDIGSFDLTGSTLADLAFDPATGILYGWQAGSDGDLYTVNLETGHATKVGESGLSGLSGGGLTFGPEGKLFLAAEGTQGKLRTINKNTGKPVDSVDLSGYSTEFSIAALAYDGSSRFLYGVTRKEGELIRIDATTGEIEGLGPTENGNGDSIAIDALAFDPSCKATPAPVAGTPTLVFLTLALLALGVLRHRTRGPGGSRATT